MPKGKPGTRKPRPPDRRAKPAKGKPLDGGKNPGGHPKEWTTERIEALAVKLDKWSTSKNARFLEAFCKTNRTYPQRLSEFAKENEKFAESLKVAKASCAANIAQATFSGRCPPAFGIFALKQHEWTDSANVKHGGSVEQKHTGTVTHTIDTTKIADLLNGSDG